MTGDRLSLAAILLVTAICVTYAHSAAQPHAEFNIDPEMTEALSPAMQHEIAGLQYLLNPYQLRQFFGLDTEDARRDWVDRWWRSQDPTPTSPGNDMRDQHYRRVQAARLKYEWKDWPGWDRRGEVLIRYGTPDFVLEMSPFVTPIGATPPGESWEYYKHDMTVVFEDRVHSGRYTFAMGSRGNPDRRRTQGGADAFGVQGNSSKPIDADFDGPRGFPIQQPVNWWYVYLSEESLERTNNFLAVLEEYPATYPFNFNREELPFVFGVGRFKGGDDVNRVEVNVEFPAGAPPGVMAGETQKFEITAVFFDPDYVAIARRHTEISLSASSLPDEYEIWQPAQLVFTLPGGYFRMAVEVREKTSGRRSAYRTTVTNRAYAYDMEVSDVLMCSRIDSTQGQSPFNRGAIEVVPHPVAQYRVSDAVPVYFELYNLETDENDMSSFTIEYWIVPLTPPKRRPDHPENETGTYAASRFSSGSHGADVPLHVNIGTDQLWAGDFEFHVRVVDERNLSVSERTARFSLID